MNNPSRVAFTLFGRDVYWYGVLMALGILIAVWLTLKEGKRKRLTEDDILAYVPCDNPLRSGGRKALLCDFRVGELCLKTPYAPCIYGRAAWPYTAR